MSVSVEARPGEAPWLLSDESLWRKRSAQVGEDTGKAFDLERNKHHTQEILGNQNEFNCKSMELHMMLGYVLCKAVQ